jgi:phospholipid-binding lipoprotein MlaA
VYGDSIVVKRLFLLSFLTCVFFFALAVGQEQCALADTRPAYAGRVALVGEKARGELLVLPAAGGSPVEENSRDFVDPLDDYDDFVGIDATIADPLESWNRFWFGFNDVLYRGVFKPINTGYEAVTPTEFRQGMRNFFRNLLFPVRFLNCLLQGEFMGAGVEASRFIINSTAGFGGLMNPGARAKPLWSDEPDVIDTSQTFGRWGMEDGFYIVWPVIGPTTARTSLGWASDVAMNPITYVNPSWISWAAAGGRGLANFGGVLQHYESVRRMAVEPYLAVRSAYVQSSRAKIPPRTVNPASE